MLERLKAGVEGDDRGWDSWMASFTQWRWVWANPRRQWRTGKPGVLLFMGTEFNTTYWLNNNKTHEIICFFFSTLFRSSLYNRLLGWPKSSFRFSVRYWGKTQTNFLANPVTSCCIWNGWSQGLHSAINLSLPFTICLWLPFTISFGWRRKDMY